MDVACRVSDRFSASTSNCRTIRKNTDLERFPRRLWWSNDTVLIDLGNSWLFLHIMIDLWYWYWPTTLANDWSKKLRLIYGIMIDLWTCDRYMNLYSVYELVVHLWNHDRSTKWSIESVKLGLIFEFFLDLWHYCWSMKSFLVYEIILGLPDFSWSTRLFVI
jgi:hypothetical protein